MHSKATPSAAVVIATHGRPTLLGRTLASFAEGAIPPSLVETLVVENGPPRGARDVCAIADERLRVRYLHIDEGHKSKALNHAVGRTTADLLCFFDDDIRAGADTLSAYVDAAARYGPGHHFGGFTEPEYEVRPPEWMLEFMPASATGFDLGPDEQFHDGPRFLGFNWAAFRKDILNLGGFAEHVGPGAPSGGNETELQMRLLAAGSRGVYLPRARAAHHVPADVCTFEWVRRRRYRSGITAHVLGRKEVGGPKVGGVPLPLLRQTAVLAGKVAVARKVFRWSEERRSWLEMELAKSRGSIHGYRMLRTIGKRTPACSTAASVQMFPFSEDATLIASYLRWAYEPLTAFPI